MTLQLNALRAVSVRVFTPWTGVWVADVDVDLEASLDVPTGRAVITTSSATLAGTIDDRASGRFGAKATVRVVGGLGWAKTVLARQFKNDAGVLTTSVFSATAAEVGETVTDAMPARLGTEYDRLEGCASSVFDGAAWYVDAAGITHVGPREAVTVDPKELQVLSWDPLSRRADLATDTLIVPGTRLVSEHFGTVVVRDVEQVFDADGARVVAWCSADASAEEAPGGRLAGAIGHMIAATVRPAYLRDHPYRVVSQALDGRLTLQLIDADAGVPKMLVGIAVWPGLPSVSVKVSPGDTVIVAFLGGDRTRPAVIGFDGRSSPAARVSIGDVPLAVVVANPSLIQWIAAVTAAINGLAPGSATPPVGLTSTRLFTE